MHGIGCAVWTDHIKKKIIEEMRKSEGIKILGPKIICLFYADDLLILAKDKEKAERSIKIIREMGEKYGLQLNEQKKAMHPI